MRTDVLTFPLRKSRFPLLTILGLIISVVMVAPDIVGFRRTRPQNSSITHVPRPDKMVWPMIAYDAPPPSDPAKAAKRKARGKKFNRSEFRIDPDDPSENTALVDAADPSLPALPVIQSSAIFIGTVLGSEAFLSDDGSGVYSEFTVKIDEVIKADSPEVIAGSIAELDRQGGRVRFPSGRIHWYSVDKQNVPIPKHQYVFFLTRKATSDAFEILTGYELNQGKVFPLDELPQFRGFDGKDQHDFTNSLRLALAHP